MLLVFVVYMCYAGSVCFSQIFKFSSIVELISCMTNYYFFILSVFFFFLNLNLGIGDPMGTYGGGGKQRFIKERKKERNTPRWGSGTGWGGYGVTRTVSREALPAPSLRGCHHLTAIK